MRQPSLWFSTLPFQFSTATRNPRNPFLNFSTSIPQLGYHGGRAIGSRDRSRESRARWNAKTCNLKSEGGVGRQAVGEGTSREGAKGDHFPKIQNGSWFPGLRWLDTALDLPLRPALFPSQAPSSRSTPGRPHGHKTSWATAALGLSQPFRAFAASRETLPLCRPAPNRAASWPLSLWRFRLLRILALPRTNR
jgi:hypothetical protein